MRLHSLGEGGHTVQWGLSWLSTMVGSVMNRSFLTGGPSRIFSIDDASNASGS